ncbi:MAG TPA: hypothetical protein VGO97_01450 [Solirubrobacterales bacterium]|jgi:hypothetical protein|nr:hypothetical protein [Solirubrobacterales bacterium]
MAVAALLLAGCGDDKTPAPTGGERPKKALELALLNVAEVDSGKLNVDGTISGGGIPGPIRISGGGPFQLAGKKAPALDLALTVELAGQPQKIGIVVVDGEAFLRFGSSAFSLGAGSKNNSPVDVAALRSLVRGMGKYVSDVRTAGSMTVEGDSVNLYTAKLDVAALANDNMKKNKSAIPTLPGLPSLSELSKSPPADVKVGVDDSGLPRYVSANARLGADGAAGTVKLTVTTSAINEPVTIKQPSNVSRGNDAAAALSGLFGALGGAGQ